MSRLRQFILIVPFVLIAIAVQMLRAQDDNQHYRVSAACNKYFLLAQRHKTDRLCVEYSDSMGKQALREHDMRAYIISLMEVCFYYDYIYDIPKMEEAAKKLREVALKEGTMRYYFRSYQTLITAHLERRAFSNALQVAEEMQQSAFKLKSNYGIWLSYKTLSEIYGKMDNQLMRRQSLLDAIDFWPNVYTENVSPLYVRLSETEQDAEKRYEDLMMGEKYAKNNVDTIMLRNGWLEYYAYTKDKEGYNNLYDKVIGENPRPVGFSPIGIVSFHAYRELFKGNKQAAIDTLTAHQSLLKDKYPRYMARLFYAADDYEELYRWHIKDDSIRAGAQRDVVVRDLYAYNARMHNDSLRYAMSEKDAALRLAQSEQERINAENARLNAEKEKEASERAKATAEAKQKDAELKLNKALLKEAKQQRLQAEKDRKLTQTQAAKARLQAENAKIQAEVERQHTWVAILVGIFVLLVVVICLTLAYARKADRDLKHIQKLNEELKKAQQEAEDANKMKDLFIQNMTHEIRTPLNAVSGFTQILTCPGVEITDAEKAEYGDHITNNVRMLTMLVDDILNISDIESGNFTITKMSTDVRSMMEGAMSVTRYRVPMGVDFKLNDMLPEGFTIKTDGSRAQQVLVNYITNACKHTKTGSIELKAEKSGDKVIFYVTDTGCGIPSDQAENIFERFTKLDAFKQGNGLGLNICRIVSNKLGGRVWLDTTYTTGARFCFELPIA